MFSVALEEEESDVRREREGRDEVESEGGIRAENARKQKSSVSSLFSFVEETDQFTSLNRSLPASRAACQSSSMTLSTARAF